MGRLTLLIASMFLAAAVAAQEVELREDHPREYVVEEGDTLWDIAGMFLTRPWQWPAIWQANPEIENPHLIFPGDLISLVYIDGEPRLVVDETRRLSPEIRREAIDGPITTIPLDAIEEFLRRPRVVSEEEFDDLAYVVANEEQRFYSSTGDRIYARGLDEDYSPGDEVIVGQLNYIFHEIPGTEDETGTRETRRSRIGMAGQVRSYERMPTRFWQVVHSGQWERWPVLGLEMWEAGTARVLQTGDPAILEIVEGRREVTEGDRILPIDDHVYSPHFEPRAMADVPKNGRVLSLSEAYFGAGQYQIVALGLGEQDGVEAGHVFSTFHPGRTVRDDVRHPRLSGSSVGDRHSEWVDLPDEYSGQVMVFRTFEKVSYAIVMTGNREIRLGDVLGHPDRRL